ncbi:MAG TPA: hypothetical protein VJ803_09150 [Gemmatimonadaceae bacterium]|nr:hypothetical protein [Gemmatimonadaceae bacterium]
MNRPTQSGRAVSNRKPFVLPKVEEHPDLTDLTQGGALVSGQQFVP